jgi:hypothetical protein
LRSPDEVLGIPDKCTTEMLFTAFDINTNLNLVDPISPTLKGNDYWTLLNDNGLTKEGLFKRAGEISKSLGINNIIFCMFDSKDARTGGGYGSQRSSSLGYRIWLYDSKTDKVIWSSAYQSKEESLTSNLFEFGERLESGIGFKTSEELIRNAFRNVVFFVFVSLLAGFIPDHVVGDMTSIGTLFAFALVSIGIILMRRSDPDAPRPFRTPFVPVVPILAVIVCGAMIVGLGKENWTRLIVWLLIGFVIYFGYSIRHSKVQRALQGK